jgi:hypothetical protein
VMPRQVSHILAGVIYHPPGAVSSAIYNRHTLTSKRYSCSVVYQFSERVEMILRHFVEQISLKPSWICYA